MKAIKLILTLTFCASALVVNADEVEKPSHGYERVSPFCKDEGPAQLRKLNSANKEKLDRINSLKSEIDDLMTYDAMLSEAIKIKKNYEGSLNSIAKAPEKTAEDITEKIGHVRSAIKNGMIIQSLSFLLEKQNAKVNPPEVLKLDNLCSNHSDESICKVNSNEKRELDLVLEAFQKSAADLPREKRQELQKDIVRVLNSIPKEIAPSAMLDFIVKESPAIVDLLKKTDSREDLIKCLEKSSSENNSACQKVFRTKGHEELLNSVINQMKGLTGKMAQYNGILNTAVDSNTSELKKSLANYKSSLGGKEQAKMAFTDASELLKSVGKKLDSINYNNAQAIRLTQATQGKISATEKKLQEDITILMSKKLSAMQGLFYTPTNPNKLKSLGLDSNNPDHAAKILKLEEASMDQAARDEKTFASSCNFKEVDAHDEDKNIEVCKGLMDKILPYVEVAKSERAKKVRKLTDELDSILDNDFKAIENLKEYIAEKYLCACEKESKVEVQTKVIASLCNPEIEITMSSLKSLSYNASSISDILYYNSIKLPQDKKDCDFKNAQLQDFKNSCSNAKVNSEFREICKPIIDELTTKARVAEDKKAAAKSEEIRRERVWKANSEKYHYVYDRTSPGGYRKIPKQSMASSIAIGVLPIIPQAMYAGLNNMVAKHSIDLLTTQGLANKQYLHNIEIFNQSPWMYSYNYYTFGNIMGIGSPINGSTTSPSTGTTPGFNF